MFGCGRVSRFLDVFLPFVSTFSGRFSSVSSGDVRLDYHYPFFCIGVRHYFSASLLGFVTAKRRESLLAHSVAAVSSAQRRVLMVAPGTELVFRMLFPSFRVANLMFFGRFLLC